MPIVHLVGSEVKGSCRQGETGLGAHSGPFPWGRGELSGSKGTNSDLDPGVGSCCGNPLLTPLPPTLPGKCPEKERGSVGASSTPFPTLSWEQLGAARGCVLGPRRPPPAPALPGKAAGGDTGVSGKGRAGETCRPRARKELPLSGKDFDAQSHPVCPLPLRSRFRHPCLLLWKALGAEMLASDSGRREPGALPGLPAKGQSSLCKRLLGAPSAFQH